MQLDPRASLNEAQEMILLTLIRAEENQCALSPADLARELNVPLAPHLQSLISQSLILSNSDSSIKLTNAGRARARALLRRHRLAERHFTDVLGLDLARAHAEADKVEHLLSSEAEATLAAQLGEPDTCPHGNPIPGARGETERVSKSLAECAPHTAATIARIALETPAAIQHLATLGLLPNVEIEIENHAPFAGPVLVRVGRAHYALGRDLANRIWVNTI
ncbi:MAG: metal-dependent transcriptional regulator [Chloroflexi bacterium]|nr:metal-dependent transcriptional regulator [Chloroflexota bacterium]